MAGDLVLDDIKSTEEATMQSYDSDVLRQLCRERSDELGRAYRQAQSAEREQRDARKSALSRLRARLSQPGRAPVYRS